MLVLDFIPSTIYDAKEESRIPLKVLKSDGSSLDKSVHVARHIFWNNGNQAISASDVLTPIRVSLLDKDTEVLSVSISEESRKVVACDVRQDGVSSFVISFRILEHEDGCAIKLFYSGTQYPRYDISTDIVGVKKVELSSDTMNDIIEKVKKQEFDISSYLNYIPQTIVFIAFIFFVALYMNTKGLPRRQFYLRTVAIIIVVSQAMYIANFLLNRSMVIDRLTPNSSKWISVDVKVP